MSSIYKGGGGDHVEGALQGGENGSGGDRYQRIQLNQGHGGGSREGLGRKRKQGIIHQ